MNAIAKETQTTKDFEQLKTRLKTTWITLCLQAWSSAIGAGLGLACVFCHTLASARRGCDGKAAGAGCSHITNAEYLESSLLYVR